MFILCIPLTRHKHKMTGCCCKATICSVIKIILKNGDKFIYQSFSKLLICTNNIFYKCNILKLSKQFANAFTALTINILIDHLQSLVSDSRDSRFNLNIKIVSETNIIANFTAKPVSYYCSVKKCWVYILFQWNVNTKSHSYPKMSLADTILSCVTFENDVIITSISKYLEFIKLLICKIAVGVFYMEL